MSEYGWVPGTPFKGDATEVQRELDRIRRTGGLTAKSVVVAAKPKRSVLHPLIFNVDKEVAAERYYLGRAGSLIKAIVVVKDGEATTIRPNILVRTSEGAEYLSIDAPDVREYEVARLQGVLMSARRMLKDLEMYPQLVLAIEEALAA